jgi:4-amino-4-deoxy-L-arabinose transferase-like glycosyltransferase
MVRAGYRDSLVFRSNRTLVNRFDGVARLRTGMSGQRARVEPGGDIGLEQVPHEVAPAQRPARDVRAGLIVAALCVVAFVLAIVVAKQLFPYLSRNPDETAYIMQSRMVREGKISLPTRTHEEFFRPALSGPHDGKVVFLYTPEWGAVLGASSALFGTTVVAIGLSAAATVAVVYLFARELFERRVALVAAALFACSPIFVVQSGTRLAYGFGVLTDVTFGWLVLRGLRTGSRVSFALAGAAFGAAVFGRAYDALLFAVPLFVYVLVTYRRRLRELSRPLGSFLLGLAPLLVVIGLVNQDLMGSPLRFPETVAGPRGGFGFGDRLALQVPHGTQVTPVHYGVGDAFLTMWRNVIETRAWIFGGLVALVLGVVGLVRVRRDARLWMLVGILVAFPVGYLFWYGIFTATSTFHGIYSYGPYYYYPAFVALAVLLARGIVALLDGRPRFVVVGAAVVLVLVTAITMRTPVHNATQNAAQQRRALRLFAGVPKRDALVVLPQYWIGSPNPTLTNDPGLKRPVLYALDRGDEDLILYGRFPKRRAFVVSSRFGAGADIFKDDSRRVIEETSVVRVPVYPVSVHVQNPSASRFVVVYVQDGDRVLQQVIDTGSARGASYDVRLDVVAPGAPFVSVPPYSLWLAPTAHGHFTVGVGFGSAPELAGAERYELRYSYAADGSGTARIVTTPRQWHRIVFLGGKGAWVTQDVAPVITRR